LLLARIDGHFEASLEIGHDERWAFLFRPRASAAPEEAGNPSSTTKPQPETITHQGTECDPCLEPKVLPMS
jgi:hypothetical protein